MLPLSRDVMAEGEIPLDFIISQPRKCISGRKLLRAALTEASFSSRINKERKEREKEYASRGEDLPSNYTSEFAEGVEFLQSWYRDTVIPLADWRNKNATADQVYEAILMGWEEAQKRYRLDKKELDRIRERLDTIRKEWRETPDPYVWQDPKTLDIVSIDDMKSFLARISDEDKRINFEKRFQILYYHKLGPHGFLTEKEHLAGVMAWWIVAGQEGNASRFDRKPDFGSLRWMNAPDRGGVAKPDSEMLERERAANKASKGDVGNRAGSIGSVGHGHIERDVATGRAVPTPTAKAGGSVGHGSFNTGQTSTPPPGGAKRRQRPTESIQALANAISEDPNDTWRDDSSIMDDDWQDTYATIARRQRLAEDDDPNYWLPSRLAETRNVYASIVKYGVSNCIYLSNNLRALREHPEAMTGRILYANSVPRLINDDEFILSGSQISLLSEEDVPQQAPAQTQVPTQPQATPKPDAGIEAAKQNGGKLLQQLLQNLQVLQKAPDWPKIKQDLIEKLKPILK